MVKSILQYLGLIHSRNSHQLIILKWSTCTDVMCGLYPWPTFHAWVTMVMKKWLCLYYSTYGCCIHQTCTNCSSWHDLLMSPDGLCPWPLFHALVTKTQNRNTGAPVMVPITIMSTWYMYQLHADVHFKMWHIYSSLKYLKPWWKKVCGAF